jgi:CRISPR-associated RAMP protein (TIGR02581 family)
MIEPVDDFHALQQRLRLTGTLTTQTALRIGSGEAGDLDAVDLPVVRDAHGYPFIPGSSLKGSLRSTVEALLRGAAVAQGTGLWSCDPFGGEKDAQRACGYHPPERREKADLNNHCAVCRLFGSHLVASHVRFTDAILSASARKSPRAPVEIRDGVAIARDLRVVHGAQKYDFEVVSPGTQFEVEVFVENPKPWLMGLLILGFDQVADGFTALGGFTSRGLGRIALHWCSIAEVTARDLLDGKGPRSFEGAEMVERHDEWRRALAVRAKERA